MGLYKLIVTSFSATFQPSHILILRFHFTGPINYQVSTLLLEPHPIRTYRVCLTYNPWIQLVTNRSLFHRSRATNHSALTQTLAEPTETTCSPSRRRPRELPVAVRSIPPPAYASRYIICHSGFMTEYISNHLTLRVTLNGVT